METRHPELSVHIKFKKTKLGNSSKQPCKDWDRNQKRQKRLMMRQKEEPSIGTPMLATPLNTPLIFKENHEKNSGK